MRGELSEVEFITTDIAPRRFSTLFLFFEIFHVKLLIIDVAGIIASRLCTMITPVARADPTKMMLAIETLHMVAAAILFHVNFAFGAGFRVGLKPKRICTLCNLSIKPFLR